MLFSCGPDMDQEGPHSGHSHCSEWATIYLCPPHRFLPSSKALTGNGHAICHVKTKQNTSNARCVKGGCQLKRGRVHERKRRRGPSLRGCLRKHPSLRSGDSEEPGRHFWSRRWQNQMETVTSDGRGLVCLLSNTTTRCAQTRRTNPTERPQSPSVLKSFS